MSFVQISSSARHLITEIVDAILWIGGLFVIWFFVLYGNVFLFIGEELGLSSSSQELVERQWPLVTQAIRSSHIPTQDPVQQNHMSTRSESFPLQLAYQFLQPDEKTTASVALVTDRIHAPLMKRYLQDRLAVYATPFSLLPPGKYLRIHRLGVEAPVVDVKYASAEQMQQGTFTTELTQWVVKYPFTAEPWTIWNTLIFWHSSVDFRETKSNPFGFIFSHLHQLEIGDTIELIWNWQQYLYSVEETVIKRPHQVNEVMQAYNNDKFLTLMACYPRFSTAQRILVVARAITPEQYAEKQLAWSAVWVN